MWLEALPGVVLTVALLYVPGTAALRGWLGLSWAQSLLFAAPIGAGIIGIVTVLFGVLTIPWNLWTALLVIVLVLLSAFAAEFFRTRNRVAPEGKRRGASDLSSFAPLGWLLLGTAVFAGMYTFGVFPALGTVDAVPTLGDSQYHLQALRIIGETGYASPFGPFGEFYPQIDGAQFYPTLWHALVSPTAQLQGVVVATNTGALALGLILWPLSLGAFALALRPDSSVAALTAPLFAAPIVLMPAIEVFAFGVYPLSLSIVLLGSNLGLLVLLVRKPSPRLGIAVLLATVGTAAAQPATALIVVAVVALWGAVLAVQWSWVQLRSGRYGVGSAGLLGLILVIVAALVGLPRLGIVQSLNSRPTESQPYDVAIRHLLTGLTYLQAHSRFIPALLALALIGAVLLLRFRFGQVMVLSAVLVLALYIAAAGPESYARIFTSPWWKDASRFAIFLLVFILAFAAYAIAAAVEALLTRVKAPTFATAAVCAGITALAVVGVVVRPATLGSVTKQTFIAGSYELSDDTTVGLTEEELELVGRLDEVLPEGAVVVGDPDSGAGWASLFSGVDQFQGLRIPSSYEQAYLGRNFDAILEDPLVCEIIKENSIVGFIQSDSPSRQFEGRYVGYNNVDVEDGFDLLLEVGDARLYEIVACD